MQLSFSTFFEQVQLHTLQLQPTDSEYSQNSQIELEGNPLEIEMHPLLGIYSAGFQLLNKFF